MKKISIIALVALAASCAQIGTENPAQGNKLVPMIFSARSNAVRTSLSDHTINWTEGDCISVFDGEGNRQFTTEGSGPSADFTGEVSPSATEFYALYPYSATASLSSGSILTTLPAAQNAVDGSFAENLYIMAGKAESTSLSMKNVCSLVKLTIAEDKVYSSISLKGNNEENLAGEISIAFDKDGNPVPTVSEGLKEVSLVPSGNTFTKGTYYLAIVPTEFTKGISLGFVRKSDSATGVNTSDVPVAVIRGQILDITVTASKIVWATKFKGDGTEASPYQIATYSDLLLLSELCAADGDNGKKYRNAFYKLTADIDGGQLNPDYSVKQDAVPFAIIGQDSNYNFKGTFDGDGHSISGLYINSEKMYAGLFGIIDGGTVKNLNVTANVSTNKTDAAILAGFFNNKAIVENCTVNGIITSSSASSNARVGGIVGRSSAASVVRGCTNNATINATATGAGYIGGIEGQQFGLVDGCTNNGAVNAYQNAGGISGYLNSGAIIVNCHNAGVVTVSANNAGGIAGYLTSSCMIANCWNTSGGTANQYKGTIAGTVETPGNVENCYSTEVFGIYMVGNPKAKTVFIHHCHWLGTTCEKATGTADVANNGTFSWGETSFKFTGTSATKKFNDIDASDTSYSTTDLLDALNHYVDIKVIEGVTLRHWEVVGDPAADNFPVLQ